MLRRTALAMLAATGLSALPLTAIAQTYPAKPITLIVPWPAGGSSDIAMRAIADAMAKILGQPMVVDNKPGASGTLGPAAMAATAKPDGYTLSQMPITVVRIPIMQKTSFDTLKDFTYIAQLTGYTFGITTKSDSPFKTWADVVKFAKENPGKLTYATPGTGTSLHIGMEMIAAKEGIKLTQVPFKGAAEIERRRSRRTYHAAGRFLRLETACRWRPAEAAGDLDRRTQRRVERRTDPERTRLSLRLR